MIFGSKEKFAIEAEVKWIEKGFVSGSFCLWLDRHQLGGPSESYTLGVCYRDLADVASNLGAYSNNRLASLDSEELLRLMAKLLLEDIDTIPDEWLAEHDQYRRFVLSLDLDRSIQECFLVFIVGEYNVRFVWLDQPFDQTAFERVHEIWITREEFVSAIKQFCDWYDTLDSISKAPREL